MRIELDFQNRWHHSTEEQIIILYSSAKVFGKKETLEQQILFLNGSKAHILSNLLYKTAKTSKAAP